MNEWIDGIHSFLFCLLGGFGRTDTDGHFVPRHCPRIHEQKKKIESFERINSIRETNGNFDSCNSCKRLVSSRLNELHESKFPFVSRIEFIRSKFSNFSAHVYEVIHSFVVRRGNIARRSSEAEKAMSAANATE